jgi:hypothetical protein
MAHLAGLAHGTKWHGPRTREELIKQLTPQYWAGRLLDQVDIPSEIADLVDSVFVLQGPNDD